MIFYFGISSKILRCAQYFQLSSRCVDIPMKHCLSCDVTYQTLETVFHRLSKHLEFRQKYSAARRIFNSLLGVWISRWNTVFRVWYIMSSTKDSDLTTVSNTDAQRSIFDKLWGDWKCLQILSYGWLYFSIEPKTEEKTEKLNRKNLRLLKLDIQPSLRSRFLF